MLLHSPRPELKIVKGIESFSKAGAVLPPRPVKGANKFALRVGHPLDLFLVPS